jgi:hypothetical protein
LTSLLPGAGGNGSIGVVLAGVDHAGEGLAAGDVNGDGLADVIVGDGDAVDVRPTSSMDATQPSLATSRR